MEGQGKALSQSDQSDEDERDYVQKVLAECAQHGVHPVCSACAVSYIPEHDGQPCQEDGCNGTVSFYATARALYVRELAWQRSRELQVEMFRNAPNKPVAEPVNWGA